MITKPRRPDGKRLVCGVLAAAAATFVVGLGVANSADAATTGTLTATASPANNQVGGTTTVTVMDSNNAHGQLEYSIVSGPDKAQSPFPAGKNITGTTFSITNGGTSGTDVIRVFDAGTGSNADFASGDANTTVDAAFSGEPDTITLTPATASTSLNNCHTFTISATDANGDPAGNATINVSATGSNGATPARCDSTGAPNANTTAVTHDDGTKDIYYTSSTAGTVTITVTSAADANVGDSSVLTVSNLTGNAAVSHLDVTPSAATGYTNGTTDFTATATDSGGTPVRGASVSYVKTGTTNYQACAGTTANNGTLTCTVNNATTAGTTNYTFFVQQANGTAGPDASEPQDTASLTVTAAPTADQLTLTCPTPGGSSAQACTVPAGTSSVTFTATVNNKDANNVEQPVSGAIVNFSVPTADGTVSPASATTDADGVATTTLTPASGANANGDTIPVTAQSTFASGSQTTVSTVTFQTATASTLTLTPASQSVATGGTVVETATVTDQFGQGVANQSVSYTVAGRNAGKAGTVTTGNDGTATISYTDTGSTGTTDTIVATSGALSKTATVTYVTGSAAPASVTLNFGGSPCTTANTMDPGTTVGQTANVCALVENANGEVLPGTPVTFTVSPGTVADTAPYADAATGTYTEDADSTGVATATVGSHQVGTQTITATAGGVSSTLSDTYKQSANPATPFQFGLTPHDVTVASGDSQKFTATVTDNFGNPLSGEFVQFTSTGPGTFGGVSSQTATTGADGTAAVTLTVPASATDGTTGTVSATDQSSGNQCGTAGTSACSASSTYTVGTPAATTETPDLSTSSAFPHNIHLVAQTDPAEAGVVVHFYTLDANGDRINYVAKATTNRAGKAHTTLNGAAAGKTYTLEAQVFTSTKYDEQVSNASTVTVAGVGGGGGGGSETPTLSTSSAFAHNLHLVAQTHPAEAGVVVHFYTVGRNGNIINYVAKATTNRAGKAHTTLNGAASGKTYRIIAKVFSNTQYDEQYSDQAAQRVA